jgi:hypothetical protein
MENNSEIEILFRRLHLYDQLKRKADGLVRTIQRAMKERYGNARTIESAPLSPASSHRATLALRSGQPYAKRLNS